MRYLLIISLIIASYGCDPQPGDVYPRMESVITSDDKIVGFINCNGSSQTNCLNAKKEICNIKAKDSKLTILEVNLTEEKMWYECDLHDSKPVPVVSNPCPNQPDHYGYPYSIP